MYLTFSFSSQAAFSILTRIETSATLVIEHIIRQIQNTFSILTRIETSATLAFGIFDAVDIHFQYPHTDRDLCNFGLALRSEDSLVLSVSSDGSRPLQLASVDEDHAEQKNFQYPHTDRDLCN